MKLFILCLSFLCLCNIHAYNILGIFPTMAKSHWIIGSSLMKALAEKGHNVTVITPFELKDAPNNFKHILTPGVFEATKKYMDEIVKLKDMSPIELFTHFWDVGHTITESTLKEESVLSLMKSKENFDVVVMEVFINDAMLGFGYHFKAPVIGISTFGASDWTRDMVGTPAPLSYIPNFRLGLTDHMNLTERITNIFASVFQRLYYHFSFRSIQSKMYDNFFPGPKPSLDELSRNVSMVLLNTHFSISYPEPYAPNMIEIGGFHLNTQIKPLPADIQKFLDSAKDGAIYFSMGSNLKSKDLPKEKLEAILQTFAMLKQKVLWKWEGEDLPGISSNVMTKSWLPQNDILAHPNIKLFITHGGLLSTMEAIYHAIPVIGIPMFGDQFFNMKRAEKIGYGIPIQMNELTEKTLKSAIYKILGDKTFGNKIKILSERFRDRDMKPIDKALYWVEYVARHKGARHMRSAVQDLSFIEAENIDALGIIFAIPIITILLIILAVRLISQKVFSKKTKTEKEQKSKTKKRN